MVTCTVWLICHCFRLLTEYHSFLCTCYSLNRSIRTSIVSVSLRSIIHSYYMNSNFLFQDLRFGKFPSPYGVSFILISIAKSNAILKIIRISVFLWSYIHFYTIVRKEFYHNKFLEYYRLIFLFLNFLFISNKSKFNSSFFRYYPITIFFLI